MTMPYDEAGTDADIAAANNMIGDEFIRSFGRGFGSPAEAEEAATGAEDDDDGGWVEIPDGITEAEATAILARLEAEADPDAWIRNFGFAGYASSAQAAADRVFGDAPVAHSLAQAMQEQAAEDPDDAA
jgi:hypothetical protein